MDKSVLDAAIAFGPGMFFAIILLYFCYRLLKWVLEHSAKREEILAEIIKDAHDTIGRNVTELGKNINNASAESQQRYLALSEASKFQREEHSRMLELHKSTAEEILKLAVVVREFECHAHPVK